MKNYVNQTPLNITLIRKRRTTKSLEKYWWSQTWKYL